jgi:D-glycero-alpha-D-manno-heptose-7-phosphate kinase
VWSKIELANSFDDISHPIVKAVLASEGIHTGVEIHHDGDLPARSGLGASSSFCVGLINAIRAYRGQMPSKADLAREAIHIERDIVGDNVGVQDQLWAAHGGFNVMHFNTDDEFSVEPISIGVDKTKELNSWMMLLFTGISRSASTMAGKQIANFPTKQADLGRMHEMVPEAKKILSEGSPSDIGFLLHEAWRLKRGLATGVSNETIDDIYNVALECGAVGGKLLGAGGGGFMLLVAPPDKHAYIRSRLSEFVHVPFKIGAEGSRVVVYENGY